MLVGVVLLAAGAVVAAPAWAAALPEGCTGAVTSGNDTIVCTKNLGSGAVVDAGDGDDSITVKADVRSGARVLGGKGKDKINVYDVGGFRCPGDDKGVGATSYDGGLVDGGDGDDAITVGGGTRPGACDKAVPRDLVPVGNVGHNAVVRGGPGNDLVAAGSLGYIWEPDSTDKSKTAAAWGGRLDGDAGDDTVTVVYATYGEHPDTADGVFGGIGNDKVTVGTATGLVDIMGDSTADGPGGGNDTITLTTGRGGLVYGGPGNDTIKGTGVMRLGTRLYGNAGNDTITAADLSQVASINGGPGDDVLSASKMNASDSASALIIGGSGNDKIEAGSLNSVLSEVRGDGDDPKDMTDGNLGTGKDIITVTTNKGVINAGNDDDTITVADNSGTVDGGNGKDTCTVKKSSGKPTITRCENK
ncbi:calcium-binding protein [Amycolatopsis sp. cg5]|uniref:calcium-binding protein n=1 Tax=Amycolatopsis sp. cg5 TaxID=3238802 RepID=UPI003525429B